LIPVDPDVGLEIQKCADQCVRVRSRHGTQHDFVADATNVDLGPIEPELLGQSHGLASAVIEELGDLHDALLDGVKRKVYTS
jgi:hypothetical protein